MSAIDHLLLNENAYFFKKEKAGFFTNRHINNLFINASKSKIGYYLLNIKNENTIVDGEEIQYSVLVFKFEKRPSFIDSDLPNWLETKIAYLLIIDFKDYVLISKKNIFGVDEILYADLETLDYDVLSTLFVEDETIYEKFALNNTSVTSDSIRGKTIEANNLRNSYSTYGAGKYVLSSIRLNNKEEKTSISLNTSRISKFGEKKYIKDLIESTLSSITKIRNHQVKECFLNAFAIPIDYEKIKDSLKPISILFNSIRLNDEVDKGRIIRCELRSSGGKIKLILLKTILTSLRQVIDIKEETLPDGNINYKLVNNIANDISVIKNKKSITLNSKKLKNIFFIYDSGDEINFTQYFNNYNDFLINFDNIELIYTCRKLFKDGKLIGHLDSFLDVFEGKDELETVSSEKGTFTTTCTSFTNDCIFSYIEDKLLPDCDYSLLDDLGDEWADYIHLKSNRISLIHAKHDTTTLSATSFHDVVGQALKNIGNFNPSSDRLDGHKKSSWSTVYNSSEGPTLIKRIRKGDNVNNAVTRYKNLLVNANLKREIIIVVNFISKSLLADRLEKLKANQSFRERNQVIQILWILSGLINSCMENGVEIHIYCKK